MGVRFKITDIDNEYFYQIPKSLLTQKNYRGLSSDAKIIYSILKDRMSLSRKHNWKDDNGDIFLIYKQTDIAEMLDLSVSSISRATKQLEKYGLIDVVRQGLNRPNKLYINKIEIVKNEEDIQDIDSIFKDENVVKNDLEDKTDSLKPDESRTCKTENPDLQIWESGFSNMGIKTCRNENQDLQIWESGFAPVQASNNYINQNNKNNNNNKENVAVNFSNANEERRENADLIKKLCILGLDEEKATELLDMFGYERVKEKLGMLQAQKGVKNAIGWLIKSLQDHYVQNSLSKQFHEAVALPTTVDNGRSRSMPLSVESIEYAASCAEAACTIDTESPFYKSFMRIKKCAAGD